MNQLTGAIPGELGNLTGLQYLDLSYTGLSGPIPEELNFLPSDTQLILVDSDLTGSLPEACRAGIQWHSGPPRFPAPNTPLPTRGAGGPPGVPWRPVG